MAYKPTDLDNTLGEVLSQHGLKQLRIAETEKYPHVTFFFSGGREESFPGEDADFDQLAQSGHLRSEAGDERL